MVSTLNSLQSYAIGLLRIIAGLLYLEHGTQKILSFPIPGPETLSGLTLLSGILEFGGGILIVLGLFTRPVAFILAGHMAFAYWMVHAPKSFFPVANGGDAAILFCFVFLMLVTTGPGAFALGRDRR
ncbi:DoxX family protein [Paracoccus sp. CPCC 101403]|uniref:DoxX family protein n=2 Tax=Paracoccus broussonetiae TaxID=3075834 RepID=A0ABU3EFS3_9RHOB|nr:DoxX family protein [Paracoccus sp. CPCC 101403]MDT1063093.1 DoxX family protein [Paracoccus sp. CPCC 101403]